jgi:hypothetical protein
MIAAKVSLATLPNFTLGYEVEALAMGSVSEEGLGITPRTKRTLSGGPYPARGSRREEDGSERQCRSIE